MFLKGDILYDVIVIFDWILREKGCLFLDFVMFISLGCYIIFMNVFFIIVVGKGYFIEFIVFKFMIVVFDSFYFMFR